MSDTAPNAYLDGSPWHLDEDRHRFVADLHSPVRVSRGNCCDHFEPADETVDHSGRALRLFRWVQRTYVAE